MTDLRKRFGRLLAAHRKRRALTQEALAEAAEVSPDTIAKIESGATGARFPVIERLTAVLEIDPAELFTNRSSSRCDQPWSFRRHLNDAYSAQRGRSRVGSQPAGRRAQRA